VKAETPTEPKVTVINVTPDHAPVLPAGTTLQRVIRDAQSGRARAPDHQEHADQVAAERSTAARTPQSAVSQLMVAAPAVTTAKARAVKLGASRLSFTVVQRDADGRLVEQCVEGIEPATAALATAPAQGGTQ
jgi:hypothetical protein